MRYTSPVSAKAFAAMAFAALLAGLFGAPLTASPVDSLTVTYVGNEGFLIEADGRKVLIDALYRTGVAGYVVHPPSLRRKLEQAETPFDHVDLVLTTHYHADHFDPRVVGSHLVNDRSTRFVSTNQAVDELEGVFSGWKLVAPRVSACSPAEHETVQMEFDGIALTCLNLHHGTNRPIENLGFLVEIGTWKFLHIGDTEATPDELASYNLADQNIDAVFLPYWFLAYSSWDGKIVSTFGDATLIGMHVPPPEDPKGYLEDLGGFESAIQKIETKYPGSMIFRSQMEHRSLQP
jgi:L-ascorbate metabolism protein UlaG (beta-lactamase superfamily)